MPNLKDTIFEQLNERQRGSPWVCGWCPTGHHGGAPWRSPMVGVSLTLLSSPPHALRLHQRCSVPCTLLRYSITEQRAVFCACRSQNNRINYGASATHSLCFLAVFMLAMLFGSQRVLASVYRSTHKRSRH